MKNIMKTIKFTVHPPKPRNRFAVAARFRKAGPHPDRPDRNAEKREWKREWMRDTESPGINRMSGVNNGISDPDQVNRVFHSTYT